MAIDLRNLPASEIAIRTSPDKPFRAQAVAYALYDGDARSITSSKALLRSYREITGGDGMLVTRKPKVGHTFSTIVAINGRRSGKSSMVSVLAIAEAFNSKHDKKLAPGESFYILVLGPNRENCDTVMSMIAGRLDFAGVTYQRTTSEIRIHGRPCVIKVTTADEIAPRGKSVALAVIDEAQHLPSDEDADGNGTEVLAAIRGACINLAGKVVLIGTPWTKSGAMYDLYASHFGKTDTDTLVVNAPTWVATDGTITEAETHKAMPDARLHAREFGAQFSEGSGTFLLASDVDAACVGYGNDRQRQPGVTYMHALDWATRGDYLASVVGHLEVRIPDHPSMPPRNVIVIDSIRLIKPEKGDRLDAERCARMVAEQGRRYGCSKLYRDIYSGDVLDALFRQYGVSTREVSSSVSAQAARFGALGARFRTHTIELPDDVPEAAKQLKALEEKLYSKGRVAYEVPNKKGHDDFCDALAILCDPENHKGLVPGGNLEVNRSVHWDPVSRHINVEERYFTRRVYGGQEVIMPAAPPSGTPAAIRAALERRARGEIAPGDDQELAGVDPSDYLVSVNTRVMHDGPDPNAPPGLRFARSMRAGASTEEADRAEGIVRGEFGKVMGDGVDWRDLPGLRGRRSMGNLASSDDVDAADVRNGHKPPPRRW